MIKEMQYFCTIIIPHYNIPELLDRCLSSIPLRKDLQVIVVDDRSNENNLVKLNEMEARFKNVTFIYSNENGGGGKARNIGLRRAEGEYVLFADADDFFNYCINDILDEYNNTSFDVIFFNATSIDSQTYLPLIHGISLQNIVNKYNKSHDIGVFKYLFGEPWCKMVKRDIIVKHGICFDEISIHNDTKFSYLVGFYSKKATFDNRALYCRVEREGSVSKKLTDEKYQIRTLVFAEKNKFLKDNSIHYFDSLMITPFWKYLVNSDKKNFLMCLSIARRYGFGLCFILKEIICFKMTNFFGKYKK